MCVLLMMQTEWVIQGVNGFHGPLISTVPPGSDRRGFFFSSSAPVSPYLPT